MRERVNNQRTQERDKDKDKHVGGGEMNGAFDPFFQHLKRPPETNRPNDLALRHGQRGQLVHLELDSSPWLEFET